MKGRKSHIDKYLIYLSGRTITYSLERKQVKNINLRIKSDGSVNVSANYRVPFAEIERFMLSKGNFILSAMDRALQYQGKVPEYRTGETVYYLGEPYIIKIKQSSPIKIEQSEHEIIIKLPDVNCLNGRAEIMKNWYRKQAANVFGGIVKSVYEMFSKCYKVPYPDITIREMKSRWGSCRPDLGRITLNTLLITASVELIEYVVIHEFAHFIYPDHSKNFWKVVSEFEPRYKELRSRLRDIHMKSI